MVLSCCKWVFLSTPFSFTSWSYLSCEGEKPRTKGKYIGTGNWYVFEIYRYAIEFEVRFFLSYMWQVYQSTSEIKNRTKLKYYLC